MSNRVQQQTVRIFPNPFFLLRLFILGILLLCFFFATGYTSLVITFSDKATLFLTISIYLLTVILGLALYILPKSFRGKLFFITLTRESEFKINEPLAGTKEAITKNLVRGYSRSSEDSSRRFVRIYFESRSSITLLPYYWTLKKIETTLKEHEIQFLGEEKFHFDFWGRPIGGKF